MTDMYKEVCDITLRLKDSRDALIRKTVVSIIPTLASYDPSTFSELYLHKSMTHLLNLLRKNSEKRDGMYISYDLRKDNSTYFS
jgi:FKBP12-rapamycin complex-associated protein